MFQIYFCSIPQLNALRCITLGSCNFPLESFIEYLSPLWKAIRQLLVMETVDFSIREAAIDAATALSSLLPTGEVCFSISMAIRCLAGNGHSFAFRFDLCRPIHSGSHIEITKHGILYRF